MLSSNLPALDGPLGASVPDSLTPVRPSPAWLPALTKHISLPAWVSSLLAPLSLPLSLGVFNSSLEPHFRQGSVYNEDPRALPIPIPQIASISLAQSSPNHPLLLPLFLCPVLSTSQSFMFREMCSLQLLAQWAQYQVHFTILS